MIKNWDLTVQYATGVEHTYRATTREQQRRIKRSIRKIARVPFTLIEN